jgi:hypothetical protein
MDSGVSSDTEMANAVIAALSESEVCAEEAVTPGGVSGSDSNQQTSAMGEVAAFNDSDPDSIDDNASAVAAVTAFDDSDSDDSATAAVAAFTDLDSESDCSSKVALVAFSNSESESHSPLMSVIPAAAALEASDSNSDVVNAAVEAIEDSSLASDAGAAWDGDIDSDANDSDVSVSAAVAAASFTDSDNESLPIQHQPISGLFMPKKNSHLPQIWLHPEVDEE